MLHSTCPPILLSSRPPYLQLSLPFGVLTPPFTLIFPYTLFSFCQSRDSSHISPAAPSCLFFYHPFHPYFSFTVLHNTVGSDVWSMELGSHVVAQDSDMDTAMCTISNFPPPDLGFPSITCNVSVSIHTTRQRNIPYI